MDWKLIVDTVIRILKMYAMVSNTVMLLFMCVTMPTPIATQMMFWYRDRKSLQRIKKIYEKQNVTELKIEMWSTRLTAYVMAWVPIVNIIIFIKIIKAYWLWRTKIGDV